MPVLLGLYRAATVLFGPASGTYLRWRERRGKEDAARLPERQGLARLSRPAGTLVWLHGASVGEALSLLPLVNRLTARGLTVLLTTGTVSSARILGQRLPPGALHQFVPLDVPVAVRRFLDHWRPQVAVLAESELWPNLIVDTTARGVPLALVNARLSPRSFARWQRLPGFIKPLLERVDLCLAQTGGDAERLTALGLPRVTVVGNLKFDAEPPPADPGAVQALAEAIASRPVWLAASTHEEEEGLILEVHGLLLDRWPDLLTIVAPRQAVRGPAIRDAASSRAIPARLRSQGETIDRSTAFYVADTMGELGLFYRLARVVFVGKSLAGSGGQNPIEPAKLGCAILHGPAVTNFAEVYGDLDRRGGARQVTDAADLARSLDDLWTNPKTLDALAAAGAASVAADAGATDRTAAALEALLAETASEPAQP